MQKTVTAQVTLTEDNNPDNKVTFEGTLILIDPDRPDGATFYGFHNMGGFGSFDTGKLNNFAVFAQDPINPLLGALYYSAGSPPDNIPVQVDSPIADSPGLAFTSDKYCESVIDDFIIPANSPFDFGTWVKVDDTNSDATFFGKWNLQTPPDCQFRIGFDSVAKRYYADYSPAGTVAPRIYQLELPPLDPDLTDWHYVRFWFDGNTYRFSVDRIIQGEANTTFLNAGAGLTRVNAVTDGGGVSGQGSISLKSTYLVIGATLTDNNDAWLYNGGNGRIWQDIAPGTVPEPPEST